MPNKVYTGQLTTGNSNKDGTTGAYITPVTGVTNGTKINQIDITAKVSTSAGMIRMFVYDGTNTRLYKEIQVPVVVVSASSPGYTSTFRPTNLIIANGNTIKFSTENSEVFDVIISVTEF